jgi:ATP-dependent Lon protease
MDARIKKLQDKIKDLQDQNAELNSSVEDIYNTINDLKYIEPYQHKNQHKNQHQHINEYINELSNKDNEYFIDYIISLNKTKSNSDEDKKKTKQFVEYLNKYLPELEDNQQRQHITYFLDLEPQQRNIILNSCNTLSQLDNATKPKIFRILESPLSDYHKKLALNKLHMIQKMDTNDSEYYKLTQWLDNLLDIPFNNYKQPSYISQPPQTIFQDARMQLDKVIYGQQKTKQHILEIVARMISNPTTGGTVFAVEGEPGTGKTTLIKDGLSQVLGLPFIFISLGGAQDASYLAGENYTYIGSKPGRIIQALKETKCMNPIFYFDELDKVSNTERGQEIINLLIHITDFAQNKHFLDYYMDGITVDLSHAMFIFSFNDRAKVCPILLDRMEIIRFHSYSSRQKKYITENYLLPKVIKHYFGTRKINIKFINKNVILKLLILPRLSKHKSPANNKMLNIDSIMRRRSRIIMKTKNKCGGVRYISRKLERIISRININILENEKKYVSQNKDSIKISITKKLVNSILDN